MHDYRCPPAAADFRSKDLLWSVRVILIKDIKNFWRMSNTGGTVGFQYLYPILNISRAEVFRVRLVSYGCPGFTKK
jgi:hypothetical protein